MAEAQQDASRFGLGAVGAAVTLMGIGSVVAKAADIEGPVLGFHRAWGAALVYGVLLLATRGQITLEKLRLAAPGGLIFGIQLGFFFSGSSTDHRGECHDVAGAPAGVGPVLLLSTIR